jgi:hypothetical protein
MFTWTPSSVLAAIDAGIVEVSSAFNNAHTFAHRRGIPAPATFSFAMAATTKHLGEIEAAILHEESTYDIALAQAIAASRCSECRIAPATTQYTLCDSCLVDLSYEARAIERDAVAAVDELDESDAA